ncbi:hypothetical protein EYF80_053682 [Liparis tanakae]|uniref:Uncharacterized protein n=1 Tax=Liparis tanakae TaxID=230148 RepID=A0A4Z2F4W4_9TELE|nr:hypothetical protein EYF80_053682 [Liparis tanakae]
MEVDVRENCGQVHRLLDDHGVIWHLKHNKEAPLSTMGGGVQSTGFVKALKRLSWDSRLVTSRRKRRRSRRVSSSCSSSLRVSSSVSWRGGGGAATGSTSNALSAWERGMLRRGGLGSLIEEQILKKVSSLPPGRGLDMEHLAVLHPKQLLHLMGGRREERGLVSCPSGLTASTLGEDATPPPRTSALSRSCCRLQVASSRMGANGGMEPSRLRKVALRAGPTVSHH